jgi:hypothetical protein
MSVILLVLIGALALQSVRTVLADAIGWLVVTSPFIALMGIPALAMGALLVPFLPGRTRVKWMVFAVMLVMWAVAFVALFTPGMVELP